MFYVLIMLCVFLCLCTASDDESSTEDYSRVEVYQIDEVSPEEQILDTRGGMNNLWGNKDLSIRPDYLLRPRKIGFMGYKKETQYVERELCGVVSPHSEIFKRHMRDDGFIVRIPIYPLAKELAFTDHWSSEQLGSNFSEQGKKEWYQIKRTLVWAVGRQEFKTIYGIASYAFEQIKIGWNAFAEKNKDNPQHKDKILENEQEKKKNLRFLSDVLACHDGRAARNIRFIEDIIIHENLRDIYISNMDNDEVREFIDKHNMTHPKYEIYKEKEILLPCERRLWSQDGLLIGYTDKAAVKRLDNLFGSYWLVRFGIDDKPDFLMSPVRIECIDWKEDKKSSVSSGLVLGHSTPHKKNERDADKCNHRFLTLLGVSCDEVQSRCSKDLVISKSYIDSFVEHGGFLNVELQNGFVGYLEDHGQSSLLYSPQLPVEGSFGPGISVTARGIARFKSTADIRRPHWPSLPQVDVQWMFDSERPSTEEIQKRVTQPSHPILSLSSDERKEHIRRFYNSHKDEIHAGLASDDSVHPYYRTLAWLSKTKILDKDPATSWMMEELLNTAGHWGWSKDKKASPTETAIFTSSAATHFVAGFSYASPYREPKLTTQGPWTHVAMMPGGESPSSGLLKRIKDDTDKLLRRFQVRDDAFRAYWDQCDGSHDIFRFADHYYKERQHTRVLPCEVQNLILSYLPTKWSLHEESGLTISSYQDGLRYAWSQYHGLGDAMSFVMEAFVRKSDDGSTSLVSTGRLNPRLSGLPTITKQAIYRMIRTYGPESVQKAYDMWWQRIGSGQQGCVS